MAEAQADTTVASPEKAQEAAVAQLEDDKPAQEGQFVGATLHLEGEDQPTELPDVEFAGPGALNRDRPGSTMSRRSIKSTTSRVSMRPNTICTEKASTTYFSYKSDCFDKGVQLLKQHIKPELDGEFKGSWLLTDIDHWDLEREKVVILTENSMLIFKYNFINEKLLEFKRVMLHGITFITIGDIKYPDKSLMPERQHGAVQIKWSSGEEPTFGQRWNLFCTTIPWVIFSHHPLIYNEKESETTIYNVDDFAESLVMLVNKAYESKRPGEKPMVIEEPIQVESYGSLLSMVYNQSGLGFCRDRNGVCY